MKIKNIANAFMRIEFGRMVLLCDPWMSDFIYEGGWGIYPPLMEKAAHIQGVTHLFISHIHEDHWDHDIILKLPRDITIVIPKVFPNHVIEKTLRGWGFYDIRVIEPMCPTQLLDNVEIEILPPMNAFGQELEAYGLSSLDTLPPSAIDCGISIKCDGATIVLLADNTPYDSGALCEATINRIKNCEVLAFPYNGAASDYPLCYDGLSFDKKLQISNLRELKRSASTDTFISKISPKSLVPYSSDFAVCGPRAIEFAKFSNQWWFNKREVAQRYSEQHGIPAYALFEKDILECSNGSIFAHSAGIQPPAFQECVSRYFSSTCAIDDLYPLPAEGEIELAFKLAVEHLRAALKRFCLASEWILSFELSNGGVSSGIFCVDFRDHEGYSVADGDSLRREGRKILTCRLSASYFYALLTGKSHWNNAQLSFQLTWERIPNEYDHNLYTALNFFHVPRSIKASREMPDRISDPVLSRSFTQ